MAKGPKTSLPAPEALGPEIVLIGEIVGAFGLKGWAKVKPFTGFVERFDPGSEVLLAGVPRKILDANRKGQQVRLKIESIDTIDEVEALVGEKLFAERDSHPVLESDEYYTADLLGLRVVLEGSGQELGVIDEVIAAPAQDLIRVGEILIPAVREFIVSISLPENLMVVRLISGMIPTASEGESP